MEITSISFVVFVAVVVLAFYVLPYDAYRLGILTTANIVFIVSFVTEFQQIVPLFAFLLLGYLTIEAVRCLRANIIMCGGISVVLVTYVFLKKFSFLDGLALQFPYLVIGLSYVLFRVLHLIIDTRGGDIAERIKPISFFNYTCNFLTFVSGPIQSYQDFANSPNHKTAGLSDDFVFRALRRIISGYVKVVIISGIANYFYLHIKNRILGPDLAP